MSDPVTNVAIEDVLSSIRRLVSEGDRLVRPDTNAAVPADARPPAPAPERLVLTPALRIAPAEVPGPRIVSDQGQDTPPRAANLGAVPGPTLVPRPERLQSNQSEARSALEQRIAELEAAVTLQTDDWEPDGSEDVPVVDWSAVGPTTLANTLNNPEGFVFASRTGGPRAASDVLDLGKAATRITLSDPEMATASGDDAEVVGDGEDLPAFAADELGEAVLTGDDMVQPEPQFDETDAEDRGEDLDLSAEQDLGRVPSDRDAASDLTLLDDAALRELVAQVVRQELQGDLGERITRNVRKMVRREIYRILASQEFE